METTGSTFEQQGFVILPPIISAAKCDDLVDTLDSATLARPGSRGLLNMPSFARLAETIGRHAAVHPLLPDQARPVQCTLFAKTPHSNWSVTPHQDLSIPVHAKRDTPGWSGWSKKEGVWFVQPPVAVLQQLVAVRLQLDTCVAQSGPLDVIPGTHAMGRLSHADVLKSAALGKFRCVVPRGGALIMRPLIVHGSSKSSTNENRRVLHFLFGPPLPPGLAWANGLT